MTAPSVNKKLMYAEDLQTFFTLGGTSFVQIIRQHGYVRVHERR